MYYGSCQTQNSIAQQQCTISMDIPVPPTSERTFYVNVMVRGNSFHLVNHNVRIIRMNGKTVSSTCAPSTSCSMGYEACVLSYPLTDVTSSTFPVELQLEAFQRGPLGCDSADDRRRLETIITVDMQPNRMNQRLSVPAHVKEFVLPSHPDSVWRPLPDGVTVAGMNVSAAYELQVAFSAQRLVTELVVDASLVSEGHFGLQYRSSGVNPWAWYTAGMNDNNASAVGVSTGTGAFLPHIRIFSRLACDVETPCSMYNNTNGTMVWPDGCIAGVNTTALRLCGRTGSTSSTLTKFKLPEALFVSVRPLFAVSLLGGVRGRVLARQPDSCCTISLLYNIFCQCRFSLYALFSCTFHSGVASAARGRKFASSC